MCRAVLCVSECTSRVVGWWRRAQTMFNIARWLDMRGEQMEQLRIEGFLDESLPIVSKLTKSKLRPPARSSKDSRRSGSGSAGSLLRPVRGAQADGQSRKRLTLLKAKDFANVGHVLSSPTVRVCAAAVLRSCVKCVMCVCVIVMCVCV